MADRKENSTKKEDVDHEAAPELTRRPSTTSTILPAYKPSDEPPPYKPESVSSSAPLPRSLRSPKPTSTGHEDSCGMPASMVMGVMGGSPGTSSKDRRGSRSLKFFESPANGLAANARDRTFGRWNVQGTSLSDFGNPFRRSK